MLGKTVLDRRCLRALRLAVHSSVSLVVTFSLAVPRPLFLMQLHSSLTGVQHFSGWKAADWVLSLSAGGGAAGVCDHAYQSMSVAVVENCHAKGRELLNTKICS